MNEPIRRRRRRRVSDSEIDLSLIARTKSSSPSPVTKTNSDDDSSNDPQIAVNYNTKSHQATIDRIRSEINEDNYHCQLNEPDYSNDTHDWGDNLESARARLLAFSWNV